MMSDVLANDVRGQYDKSFATIRGIAERFPDEKWLEPHGDVYYIPSRIAYHLAVFVDALVAGGMKDPDFNAKLPFGAWQDGTAETLPKRADFITYFDAVVVRAQKELAALDDAGLTKALEPERARFGASPIGMHLYFMREMAAHSGELNKMLIENGLDDVWVSR